MIDEVDAALRALLKEEALDGAQVDVVFDAPTKEWAARRNAPMVNAYLYDIREDLRKRTRGMVNEYDALGLVVGRRLPPRFYNLSYLVTAWTQRPEDEHRLLAQMLMCFTSYEAMPPVRLTGSLGRLGLPVEMRVSLPPPEDRSFADVWTALGGELKPSIDVVLSVPLAPARVFSAGPPVKEGPVVRLRGTGGEPAARRGAQPKQYGSSARVGAATGQPDGPEESHERVDLASGEMADETVRGRPARPVAGSGAGAGSGAAGAAGGSRAGGGTAGKAGRADDSGGSQSAAEAWLRLAGRTSPPSGAGHSDGAADASAAPGAAGRGGAGRKASGSKGSGGRGGRRGMRVTLAATSPGADEAAEHAGGDESAGLAEGAVGAGPDVGAASAGPDVGDESAVPDGGDGTAVLDGGDGTAVPDGGDGTAVPVGGDDGGAG